MEDLRSGIEHLKQAKAHMSKANGIMSNCISKLKFLEEENAGLGAKLEALIQSDDSYMKLPLDADGVPIHIGDTVWYIGIDAGIEKDCPLKVDGLVMEPFDFGIFIETQECPRKAIASESLTHKRPEPPDSWEKLEEDVNLGCRDYCKKHRLEECDYNMRVHMLARAKKLAGIEEA